MTYSALTIGCEDKLEKNSLIHTLESAMEALEENLPVLSFVGIDPNHLQED